MTAPVTEKPAAPPAKKSRARFIPVILVVLGVAAFFIWRGFFASPKVPDNLVILSGRIEGDDSAVAAKTTGRLLEIRVREGDRVKAGDTIAVIDDDQMRARSDQAQAALAGAEARVKAARDQIAVYRQQLGQNSLETEQSKVDASGRVRNAEAGVAAEILPRRSPRRESSKRRAGAPTRRRRHSSAPGTSLKPASRTLRGVRPRA